jgi:hypothetical protein
LNLGENARAERVGERALMKSWHGRYQCSGVTSAPGWASVVRRAQRLW